MVEDRSRPELPAKAVIPVTIVGGYLGAGKTSLVNHILRENAGLRLAVVVNDFGALNIDAALIESRHGDTINLANGCICCSLAGGLATAMNAIRDRPAPPERVVIEASGVADPARIAQYAHLPGFGLDGVVVLADAETVRRRSTDKYVGRQVVEQLQAADLLLLNKLDLVSEAERRATRDWLRALVPDMRLLEVEHGRAPVELLFGVTPRAHRERDHEPDHALDHAHDYASRSFSDDRPVDGAAFRALIAGLPVEVLRGKGFLHLAEDPSVEFVFQLVGKRWSLVRGAPWGARRPTTAFVLIGLPRSLDGVDFHGLCRQRSLLARATAETTEGDP